MTAYRVDHIGIAVVSIDDALAIYRALGLPEAHREEVPAQKVMTAFLPVGESRIELLEPTSEDSPVAKFLARRGPGLHHICFSVADLEATLADLARRGYRLLHTRPVTGAEGRKVAFLNPDSGNGVLIELTQSAEGP